MKQNVNELIRPLVEALSGQWIEATKAQIETVDGRTDKTNLICKKASCLYLALADEIVLYVGETSKSIKRRFISDGSGSHRVACSNWYPRMTKVRFVVFDEQELPVMHRKLLEQALSIHYEPEFYANRA